MSATNHTPNLNLSQFIPLDKPAWLGDYNSDMSKIDTAVHKVQTQADSMETAVEQATTAAQAATQAAQAATEAAQDAADKAQDAETTANNIAGSLAGKVNKTGDTMTGPLVLPGDPKEDNQAATKGYVDSHGGGLPLSGGTLTGPVHFTNNGVKRGIIQANPEDFSIGVDSEGGTTLSFPASGVGIQFTGNLISKNGTGRIKNLAAPTEAQDAATKAYVDAKLSYHPILKDDTVTGAVVAGYAIQMKNTLMLSVIVWANQAITTGKTLFKTTGFSGLTSGASSVTGVINKSNGSQLTLSLSPNISLGTEISFPAPVEVGVGDYIIVNDILEIS